MRTVKWLKQTCGACPEAYEGQLESGEEIYLRCRWGYARLDINDVTVTDMHYGDNYQGMFNEGDVAMLLREAGIEWDGTYDT